MPQKEEVNQNDLSKEEDRISNIVLRKTRCIMLTGEVNKKMTELVCKQLLYLNDQSAEEPIQIYIDSPGGDADAGYAIFDMIRFLDAPVYTIGLGLVASAGALILIASPKERRLSLTNSHYMIHQPLSGTRGVASEIEIHAKEVEKLRERINRHIAEATGKELELVAKDTDRNYWLGAEEALAYGLITKIIGNMQELRTFLGQKRDKT